MPSVKIYNMSGKEVGQMELNEDIFGCEYNEPLIHQAVVTQQSNERQGTKSTLTRAEVRGGGKKPWRQKGTGRARQGSTRSPQWTGGGVVFAPKPRDFSKKMNIRARRAAIASALSEKVRLGEFIVIDSLSLAEAKTKEMAKVLKNLKLDCKVLLALEVGNKNAVIASANLPDVITVSAGQLSTYDVVNCKKLLITKDGVNAISEVLA